MYDEEVDVDPQILRKVAQDPTIALITSDVDEPIKGKSIINYWERDVYAKVIVYADKWDLPWLKQLVIEKMKIAPSVGGQARKEIVTIMAGHPPQEEKKSLLPKILKKERY